MTAAGINERNWRMLQTLNPACRERVDKMIGRLKALGYRPVIWSGLRTAREQAGLYQKGRKCILGKWRRWPPAGSTVTDKDGYARKSNHQERYPGSGGFAADVVPCKRRGQTDEYEPSWKWPPHVWADWKTAAMEGGLAWGGDWKLGDKCHVEMA